MNSPQSRLTLLGLALGILLALLLAPQTRWLVRLQMLPRLSGNYDQQRQQFVQTHPNDYPVQLAAPLPFDSQMQRQMQYARSLVPRFPNSPSLRANILRYTMSNFHLRRNEENLLQGIPKPPVDPHSPLPTPAELAAYDADAAAGERLDPDNAYFPLMRSIGLLAAHRDADGLAAVRRASEEHFWREYFNDQVEGGWRINDGLYGGREALSSMAVSGALVFPHYAPLRQVARIVTYKAILQEKAGHPEAGLALRRQVMRCGDLMRVQSSSLIGNFVGMGISADARERPGGAARIKREPNELNNEAAYRRRLDAYCVYVTRMGHPEAAAEARAQFEVGEQLRHKIIINSDLVFGLPFEDIMRLSYALVAGWILCANVLTTLLIGLAAAALCRLPQIRERRPLPAGSASGIWGVLLAGLFLAMFFINTTLEDFTGTAALCVLAAVSLAGLAFAALLLPRLRRPILQSFRAALLTLIALGVFGGLSAWQMHGGGEVVATLRPMLSLSDGPLWLVSPEAGLLQAQAFIGLTFGLASPLLLILVLSIAAPIRRVSVSVGLTEGFRAAVPPLLCLLMLTYGGLILWTVRQEARVNYGLERSLHGEGQYLAQLTGQPWPGPVQ